MKVNEKPINYEREQDNYSVFEKAVETYFDTMVSNCTVLYRVNAPHLWETYLANLPDDGRFVYDCRTCKNFIERYGNIVTIDEYGKVVSVLWGTAVPVYFADSVEAMNRLIQNTAKVSGVFISDIDILGTPITGVWTHLHAVLPNKLVNHSRTKNADQIMAEKLEDFRILFNALQQYPMNVVEQAVLLLQTNTMYRGDQVLGIAEWFKKVHESIDDKTGVCRTNLIWKAVGEAPAGFCHIKSSMIGTLLDDILAGYSTRVIMARFEEKMNPQNYMRSQSAPTAAAIEQAEKLVEKLGIEDSLRRRYARFDEMADKCIWKPKVMKVADNKKSTGVFSHLTPKDTKSANDILLYLPTTIMTWEKFTRTILPTAEKIAVKIDNPNRFMALVTEAVKDSENIFQWDNPFSWYYHGGIDGEIKRRVESAGGRYENCAIRCSLIWNSYTDLDLHCITPHGGHIWYNNKRDLYGGGYLDVDANGGIANTTKPVENIRWSDHADNGHYRFFVHNYRDRNHSNNPYKIELEIGGKVYSHEGYLKSSGEQAETFEFDYRDGIVTNLKIGNSSNVSDFEMWGLTMNQFVNVKGIVKSPNMWGGIDNPNVMDHTFFILDGCKDTSEGLGRGFFNEILKPELRGIRKTLELYSANTPIEDAENADACGVGFYKDSEWDLILRVESDGNSRLIKIDRFD